MPERGWLLESASASGYGVHPGQGNVLIISGLDYWNGFLAWGRAGDGSASATVFGTPHPELGWFPISSLALTGSGSAILSANYGYLRASLFWTAASPTAHLFAQWAR